MRKTVPLSHDELKALLEYDPLTGVFRWRVWRNGARRDLVAGCRSEKYGALLLRIKRKTYTGGPLAWFYMTGMWPIAKVVPRNGDPFDVRFENLRHTAVDVGGVLVTPKSKDGIRHHNKKYRAANAEALRNRQLKYTFGIEAEEYDRMLAEQNGVCAICEQPERAMRNGKVKMLSVDHDHVTQEVRGLLCHACNVVLGYAGDQPEILRRAARYLERQKKADNVVRLVTAKES